MTEEEPQSRLAQTGDAAAVGLALALLMALPTIVRCASAGLSLIDGTLAATAVTTTLALPLAFIAPRTARGFRGVVGRSVPRAVGVGIVLWLSISAVLLVGLAAILKAKTHHRGLGGATFGVFGAAAICAAAVVAARVVSVGRDWLERGLPRAVATTFVAAAGTLALGALALPLVRGGDPHPARAALFDLLLWVAASAVLLPRRTPTWLARPSQLLALPISLSLLGAGWYRIETSTEPILRDVGGVPATILGGLRAWSDHDHDGVAAHFGGPADCDEGDPTRHPGAADAEGDGVDTNCDGVDGVAVLAVATPEPPPAPAAPPTPPASASTVAASAPGAIPSVKQPDIILVTFDTTRADRCSLYGYERPTTPHLKALGEGGIVFEHAYATGSDTQRALMPLVTGRALSRSPTTNIEWPRLRDEAETVAERLKKSGYKTGAVTSFTWLRGDRGFDQGFDHFDMSPWKDNHPEREVTGEAAGKAAIAVYEKLAAGDAPLFLWLHLFDPHDEYLAHPGIDHGESPSDLYDGEIQFADLQLGELVAAVEKGRRRDRTAWLVHGSHGEAFGEHDDERHGNDVYEEQVRVPMVLVVPGAEPRRYGERPVSNGDIAATILDLGGASRDGTEGVSLLPIARGESLDRQAVLTYSDRRTAVVEWPLKLRVFRRDSGKDRLLLFDLADDPGETKDLSADRNADLKRLVGYRDDS